MKRTVLIFSLLLMGFGAMAEKPRFIYGLDWGFSENMYTFRKKAYHNPTPPQYVITDNMNEWNFFALGDISAYAGMSFGKHSELSLVTGYAGIAPKRKAIETTVRYSFFFKGYSNDSPFLDLSAGPGWIVGGGKNAWMAGIGTGYRVKLGNKSSFDFKLTLKETLDRPKLIDAANGNMIDDNLVLKNQTFYSSVRIGLAINF